MKAAAMISSIDFFLSWGLLIRSARMRQTYRRRRRIIKRNNTT
jgi:hypothetical protein